MKKILFTFLAVLILVKNVYSTEVDKNFYLLLPTIHCDNGKISTEKEKDEKYIIKIKIIEMIEDFLN